MLLNNCFPTHMINKQIKQRLKKIRQRHDSNHIKNKNNQIDLKKSLYHTKEFSENIECTEGNLISRFYSQSLKSWIVLLKKAKMRWMFWGGLVYIINCSNCNTCYIGQTKRHFETCLKEHQNNLKKHISNYSVVSKQVILRTQFWLA